MPFESAVHDVDVVLGLVGDDHDLTGTRSAAVLKPGGLYLAVASGAPHHRLHELRDRGIRAKSFLVDSGALRVEVAGTTPLARAASRTGGGLRESEPHQAFRA